MPSFSVKNRNSRVVFVKHLLGGICLSARLRVDTFDGGDRNPQVVRVCVNLTQNYAPNFVANEIDALVGQRASDKTPLVRFTRCLFDASPSMWNTQGVLFQIVSCATHEVPLALDSQPCPPRDPAAECLPFACRPCDPIIAISNCVFENWTNKENGRAIDVDQDRSVVNMSMDYFLQCCTIKEAGAVFFKCRTVEARGFYGVSCYAPDAAFPRCPFYGSEDDLAELNDPSWMDGSCNRRSVQLSNQLWLAGGFDSRHRRPSRASVQLLFCRVKSDWNSQRLVICQSAETHDAVSCVDFSENTVTGVQSDNHQGLVSVHCNCTFVDCDFAGNTANHYFATPEGLGGDTFAVPVCRVAGRFCLVHTEHCPQYRIVPAD
jgi:hypothetical protein